MRRMLAVAALATALFAAACGSDDSGTGNNPDTGTDAGSTASASPEAPAEDGGNTEEACAAAETAVAPLVGTEFQSAVTDLATAAATGDAAALEEASATLEELTGQMGTDLRDAAATAADAELKSALETMAGELENIGTVVSDIESADPAALAELQSADLEAATNTLSQICG